MDGTGGFWPFHNVHLNQEALLNPATPPTIVLEQPAPCAESAENASELFASALPVTSGDPLAGWSVHVRVASVGHDATPMLRADGELLDARGVSIARRSFTNHGTTCAPLAKAIGVWASLALDDERTKVEAAPDPNHAIALADTQETLKKRGKRAPGSEDDDVDPDLQPNRPPPPAQSTREIGAAGILEGGIADRPLFGPAIYGVMEIGKGLLLRPTVAFDTSFASDPTSVALHAGTRIDLCGRLRGNYERGLDAELCLGSEMGFLKIGDDAIPLLGVGPALGLQGDLAEAFAVTLRGIGEINLIRDSIAGSSPETLAGRVELGMTWKLQ
jgi:hypothetical protein